MALSDAILERPRTSSEEDLVNQAWNMAHVIFRCGDPVHRMDPLFPVETEITMKTFISSYRTTRPAHENSQAPENAHKLSNN